MKAQVEKHEWEYADALKAVQEWATGWLEPETQDAWLVGVEDLEAAVRRRVQDAALALGWWQDVDEVWHKPVGTRI